MTKRNHRRKIRSCIRKDTYRYYIKDRSMPELWAIFENFFGKSIEYIGFNLLHIENKSLILRWTKEQNSFTLIKKKSFLDEDENFIHKEIGLIEC